MRRKRIRWYDWMVYRLFRWRWEPIIAGNPVIKEAMIAWMKASDVLSDGDRIKVTVTIEPPDHATDEG